MSIPAKWNGDEWQVYGGFYSACFWCNDSWTITGAIRLEYFLSARVIDFRVVQMLRIPSNSMKQNRMKRAHSRLEFSVSVFNNCNFGVIIQKNAREWAVFIHPMFRNSFISLILVSISSVSYRIFTIKVFDFQKFPTNGESSLTRIFNKIVSSSIMSSFVFDNTKVILFHSFKTLLNVLIGIICQRVTIDYSWHDLISNRIFIQF